MVKTAVILAAGLGSRLKEKTKDKPKGFLEIDSKTLIQRSVENLLNCGIEKIYIGTGYLSEVYDEFAKRYKEIETVKSEKFETTSSMFTLYNMKKRIDEDFLLLESDLLYEKRALMELLCDEHEDVILASGATNSGDEVYIDADKSYFLKNMSKTKDELSFIYGELVGISKVSFSRFKQMCEIFKNQDNQKIDYEYIMVESAKDKPFYVKKIEDLIWCEIDNDEHLKRAYKEILPLLNIKEWSELKVKIQKNGIKRSFEERDILFIFKGQNIGIEQHGKGKNFLRPVLVYKKFNNNHFIGFSMTSKAHNGKYYFKLKDDSFVILSQINTYSSERIFYKSGKVSKENFKKIDKQFKRLITPYEPFIGVVPSGNK